MVPRTGEAVVLPAWLPVRARLDRPLRRHGRRPLPRHRADKRKTAVHPLRNTAPAQLRLDVHLLQPQERPASAHRDHTAIRNPCLDDGRVQEALQTGGDTPPTVHRLGGVRHTAHGEHPRAELKAHWPPAARTVINHFILPGHDKVVRVNKRTIFVQSTDGMKEFTVTYDEFNNEWYETIQECYRKEIQKVEDEIDRLMRPITDDIAELHKTKRQLAMRLKALY